MSLVDYTRTNRPVFDIDLDAPPYERWAEVGRRNRAKLARFMRDIEAMSHELVDNLVDRSPDWFPESLRRMSKSILKPLLAGASRLTGKLGAQVARSFGEDYADEIRGLAHTSGLPESKLFLANLTYDVSVELERRSSACSSFSVVVGGAPVLVRNMDWARPESTGRFTVMTRFHQGDASYVNIAPLGCVGVLSAMRVGAWAVTLNQASPTGPLRIPQWPVMHRIRKACDTSLTFSSLVRQLTEMETMSPFFAHVVGTKPNQQVVVEGTSEAFLKRRAKPGRPIIQTNHFVHSSHRHHNGPDWQGRDCEICDRYAALEQRLRRKPKDFADAFSRIRGQPVTHSETMNQMALRPIDGKAVVRVRK